MSCTALSEVAHHRACAWMNIVMHCSNVLSAQTPSHTDMHLEVRQASDRRVDGVRVRLNLAGFRRWRALCNDKAVFTQGTEAHSIAQPMAE